MFNDRTQKMQQDDQRALVSLWNALGLSYQSYTDSQSRKKQADEADDELTLLDYDVLIRYQSENRTDSNCLMDNGRQHFRYPVDDECQFRMIGMSNYGRAVLQNISASGIGIGVYRKLDLNHTITILIETNNPKQLPLLIRATIVRYAGMTKDCLYCYGCEIERIIDPNF